MGLPPSSFQHKAGREAALTPRLHHRLLHRGLMAYARLSRGMTLGVRAMLLRDGHIMLVRHTYTPGWHLPGGGVERGESLADALARETYEEANAILTGQAQLFAVYRNQRSDHVALFVCREWAETAGANVPNREILAAELFPLHALPPETTRATRVRIEEVLNGVPPSSDWQPMGSPVWRDT